MFNINHWRNVGLKLFCRKVSNFMTYLTVFANSSRNTYITNMVNSGSIKSNAVPKQWSI